MRATHTPSNRFVPALAALALGVLTVFGVAPAAQAADDPAFVAVGLGAYDWNRQKDQGVEARLEYRGETKYLGFLKPFVAVAATNSSSSFFVGAGVLADLYFGKRFVVTPSFAPHFYHGGNAQLDLDYALEFRSQLELAYRFDDRSRLGVAVSHYSNASLGKTNPGTESAMVYYAIPVDFFD